MPTKSFLHSFRSLADMFRPPFEGLWLFSVLFFGWCYLVFPHSAVLRAEMPDTDDYMYLTQILDWMNGQGWYDNVQHRMNPPMGVPIHFSRLVMLPMAGMIGVFELLGLGPKGAATVMAMTYPLILLGVFFITMRWVAESFMPKAWAGVTAYVGLFAGGTLYMFQPGHVDHHNLIAVLVAVALGCALRMMQRPDLHRWPLYAGLTMAFGLVAALEILPWILLLSAYLGLWGALKGGNAARGGLLYSLVLFVGSIIGLLLTRPPADLFNMDVLTYSVVYVILNAGIAVAFAGVYLTSRMPLALRLLVGGGVAAATGVAFLHHFPELISGPYGGIDPALQNIILDEINEAQPMKFADNSWLDVFWVTASTFLAIPVALWFFKQAKGVERWMWGLLTLLLLAAAGLACLYQRRFGAIMCTLTIVPLAVLLQRGWGWIGARYRGRRQFFAELALILLVGPLPAIFVPALVDGRSFNLGVLLFPVSLSPTINGCESFELENALRDPRGLGKKPLLIMNSISEGPEILFRTPHQILAAPFHMDVTGNVDSTRFFSTPYPEEAEAIARRRHVDLVVTCYQAEEFYFQKHPGKSGVEDDKPGQDFAPHFIERLIYGHIPAWLKPVKIPGLANFVIYEVLPPAGDAPAK